MRSAGRTGRAPPAIRSLADAVVDPDVGAAKAVDRLLRIADDEQRTAADREVERVPRVAGWLVRRQHPQQVGLQRIGVLEFVHQDEAEPALKLVADVRHVAHEVARADQQIEEIERPGAHLSLLVAIDARLQLAVQQRGEIGVRRVAKPHQGVDDEVARFTDRFTRRVPANTARACCALCADRARARRARKPRLPALEIRHPARSQLVDLRVGVRSRCVSRKRMSPRSIGVALIFANVASTSSSASMSLSRLKVLRDASTAFGGRAIAAAPTPA